MSSSQIIEYIKKLVESGQFTVKQIAEQANVSKEKMYKWLNENVAAAPKALDLEKLKVWIQEIEKVPQVTLAEEEPALYPLKSSSDDYRAKYEKLLETTNIQLANTLNSLLNDLKKIDINLNTVLKNQEADAISQAIYHETGLKALSALQKDKADLWNTAYNRVLLVLGSNRATDKVDG